MLPVTEVIIIYILPLLLPILSILLLEDVCTEFKFIIHGA